MQAKDVFKLILVSSLLTYGCSQDTGRVESHKAFLSGTLLNFGNSAILERNDLYGSLMDESYILDLTEKGDFQITLTLDKPTYYRLGRNHLYVSPGDSLKMTLDFMDPEKSRFQGRASTVEVNTFLSKNPFPKAGSYAGEKAFYGQDHALSRVPQLIHSRGMQDLKRLNNFKNLPEDFRKLEKARINYHCANSLIRYSNYAERPDTLKSREDYYYYNQYFLNAFAQSMRRYFTEYQDESHMDLPVLRSLIYSLLYDDFYKQLGLPEPEGHLREYIIASQLAMEVQQGGINDRLIFKKDSLVSVLQGDIYVDFINGAFQKMEATLPGLPAADFPATSWEGDEVRLSDLKGKLIVVDVWATWCGPCIQETPYFEEIEEKYSQNDDVVFLALSIDRGEETWKKHLEKHNKTGHQWLTAKSNLGAYEVAGIPRYFVIGKDMTIINVFAPRPSSGDLEKLIEKSLSG